MSIKPLESIHAQAIEGSKTHPLNNTEDKTKELVKKHTEVLKAQDPAALPETLLLQEEVLQVLISTQEFKENMPLESVCTRWQSLIRPMQIEMINSQKIPLGTLFSSANAAIDYLLSSPHAKNLKYADFTGFDKEFTNSHLKALTKGCPNLEYLIIPKSSISDEGLKCLRHIPNLKRLNIAFCTGIAADSLKYLSYVPGLHDLSINGCCSLERDMLKNLELIKGLRHLDITGCAQLEPEVLKNLAHTPDLERLVMNFCTPDADTLKYLEYVPKLKHLEIHFFEGLEPDALKNLAHTPDLERLIMNAWAPLDADTLKYLEYVPKLKHLDTSFCWQLDPNTITTVFPNLHYLNVTGNNFSSLDFLKFVPNLEELDLGNYHINGNDFDAFMHTPKLRKLKSINIHHIDNFVDNIEKVPELLYVHIAGNSTDLKFRHVNLLERHGVKIKGRKATINALKLADKEKKLKRFYLEQSVLIVACIALHFFS